jgi:xylulokinase
VLEGCAFAMRDVVDRFDALGLATSRVRLSVGGAKSRIWARIRADIVGRPVEVASITDTSPIGAAILAATSVGLAASPGEMAAALLGRVETIDPDSANAPVYDRDYQRYRALFEALTPLYRDVEGDDVQRHA